MGVRLRTGTQEKAGNRILPRGYVNIRDEDIQIQSSTCAKSIVLCNTGRTDVDKMFKGPDPRFNRISPEYGRNMPRAAYVCNTISLLLCDAFVILLLFLFKKKDFSLSYKCIIGSMGSD